MQAVVVAVEAQKMQVQQAVAQADRVLEVPVQPGQDLLPRKQRPEPRIQEAVVVVALVQVAEVQAMEETADPVL
jgi:hypothetical protein